MDGDARGGLGHPRLADRGADVAAIELDPLAVELDPQRSGQRAHRLRIVEVGPALDPGQRHAAVHRPRVEVGEAERRGDGTGDSGLAGPGGTVDRDDHGAAAYARPGQRVGAQRAREGGKVSLEAGIADRRGVHPLDLDPLARGEAGNRTEHRYPVVAVRVDRAATQAAPPPRSRIPSSLVSTLAPSAVSASLDGGDPVTLLAAQLGRVADRRLALGEAGRERNQRQLVDRQRDRRRRRPRSRAAARGGRGGRPLGSPPRSLFGLDLDLGPHPLEDREQAGAGRVEADSGEGDLAAGDEQRRDDEEGGRGEVGGDGDLAGLEPRRRAHGDRAVVTLDLGAGRGAASARCGRELGSGSTIRVSPSASRPAKSRQDLTWALATGSSYAMPRSGAASIRSGGRRSSRHSSRAPIRRSGAAIRSTGRRRIESSPSSVQAPVSCPASQPGSRRSRVPALPTSIVGRGGRRAGRRRARAVAGSIASAPTPSTSAPSALHRVQGRARVGGVQVALDRRLPLPHRRDQRRPVGDRLVGRRPQGAAQRPGGIEAGGHAA